MTDFTWKAKRAALAATVAFAPVQTIAQDADAPIVLDDVVLKGAPVDVWRAESIDGATRTRTPLNEVPQSVQVIPQQLIEEQNAQSVAEVLRNVPGVVVSRDDEIFLNAPIIRGFEARTFFDGQPAFSFTNSADPLTAIHVERVEVLTGPSGALFGGGGVGAPLGGIINIVRKRPEAEGFFGEVLAEGGSFGEYDFGADVNAPLTENGSIRFRMQGDYRTEDGFIDDTDAEQFNLFPALEVDLSEKTTFSVLGFYGRREFVEYPGLPPAVVNFGDFDERQFPGALNPPESVNETYSVQAFIDHSINANWSAHGSFQYLVDDFEENDSFADGAFFDIDPTDTSFPIVTGQLTNEVEQITANIWTVGEFQTGEARHTLLLGAEFDNTDYQGSTTFLPTGESIDLLNPVRPDFTPFPDGFGPGNTADIENTSFSLYAQNQVTIAEDFHLTGSIRYTRLETDDAGNAFAVPTEIVTNEFTPRIGVAYDVTDEVTLFAGYGEGFQQVLFFTPQAPGDTPVPERSEQVEGVKFNFANGLSGSVAGFYVERSNVPVIASVPGNPFGQIQSGKQRAQGIEAELLWQPIPELSVLANFTYQDAEVTEDTTLPVGDDLFRVPEAFGRIAAQYRFLDGDLRGLSIGAGATASTGAEASLPNTFKTESFIVVDARAAYDFGPAVLSASVENLFDEEYFVPHGFFNATVAPGRPRTFLAQLRVKF